MNPPTRRVPVRLLLDLAVISAAAIIFLAVFQRELDAVPAANYQARDDAIITLSHARNLAEYGFIGVSPSGERIEGFSAPLQFWIAWIAYLVRPFDYTTFL